MDINKNLQEFFDRKKQAAKRIDDNCLILVNQIEDLTLRGGKRIRPYLCWIGYHTISNIKYQISNILLNAMMGLEVFHTFALIHDDIIDQDTERRGGPTVHKQVGLNLAILAGDLALVWADELMQETNNKQVLGLYAQMKQQVIYGQMLDVLSLQGNQKIDKAKIDELKTAWYSVVRPLQIGAALAGATKREIDSLAEYGVPAGKLFQLKDDLMDRQISLEEFNQQVPTLQTKARAALKQMKISRKARELLSEFTQFVTKRRT